jgi:hypothetical protein
MGTEGEAVPAAPAAAVTKAAVYKKTSAGGAATKVPRASTAQSNDKAFAANVLRIQEAAGNQAALAWVGNPGGSDTSTDAADGRIQRRPAVGADSGAPLDSGPRKVSRSAQLRAKTSAVGSDIFFDRAAPPLVQRSAVIRRVTEESVDEHVKMGGARKASGGIAEQAKHGGLDSKSGLVLPSKIKESMEAPEQMVLGCGSKWKEVKTQYIADEPKMRLLLQYRIHEVGRIYKQVIGELWRENAPLRAKERAIKGSVPRDQLFQLNDLQFSMMGSTDLTSDYDVSFDHVVTKPWIGVAAVKAFNRIFREKWKAESGTVFDTNVYTQGFMPSDMSNIPTALPGAIDKRRQGAEALAAIAGPSQKEAQDLVKSLKSKHAEAVQVRSKMAADAIQGRAEVRKSHTISQAKVFAIEDVMSLVKIRKFMNETDWATYSTMLLSELEGPAKAATKIVLKQADDKYKELDAQLEAKKAALRVGRPEGTVDDEDLELEASNRLYEEYLVKAAAIVAANHGVLEPGAIAKWTEQQSTALYFANEAYHTSGPVESTVIGQQMGIKMAQTPEQHMQAINEQTGFVVEQHHATHAKPPGRFLWKSSKYVDRICAILNLIRQDVPGGLPDVLPLEPELRSLSAALLVIKKGTLPDEQKDTASVEKATLAGPPVSEDVQKCVLRLNADVNQRLRNAKNSVQDTAPTV